MHPSPGASVKLSCRDPLLAAVTGLNHLAVGTGLLAIPGGAFKSPLRTLPVKRLILAPAGSDHSADRLLLNPDASADRPGPVTRAGRGSVPELTWGSKFMVRVVRHFQRCLKAARFRGSIREWFRLLKSGAAFAAGPLLSWLANKSSSAAIQSK